MVLAGLWVMATLIVSTVLLAQTLFGTSSVQGAALLDASRTAVERGRTRLSVASIVSSDAGGGTNVTITADNIGEVSIVNSAQMDMLVRYTQDDGSLLAERLTYGTCAPGTNQWCLQSMSPDTFNPGLWDPGERATLQLRLAPQVKSGTTATVVVVAPNGISAVGNFTN